MAIIWPLVVVLIWAAVFGIALLLVRMTTRDQQAVVSAEHAAERRAQEPESSAPAAAPAPTPVGPPLPA